jgi:polysaccharide deacetylase 2 family uncharacterized protein YibQ
VPTKNFKEGMKFIKGFTGLILLLIILLTSYYIFFRPPRDVYRAEEHGAEKEATRESTPAKEPNFSHQNKSSQEGEKTIAIIIDDIGFALAPVDKLLRIGAPLAFAVLPYSPHAKDAAEMIHAQGHELLLHLPMEPRNGKHKPGPGALFRDMAEQDIRQQLDDDLAVIPYVTGVNNHMGSAFMEDEVKLMVVLKELQKKGLFFIDSRTTSASRAEDLARKTGIRFAARRLFLDNDQDQGLIFRNLLDNVEKNKNSSLVIIGHPYPSTIEALQEAVPLLQSRGIRIVPPSELVATIGPR